MFDEFMANEEAYRQAEDEKLEAQAAMMRKNEQSRLAAEAAKRKTQEDLEHQKEKKREERDSPGMLATPAPVDPEPILKAEPALARANTSNTSTDVIEFIVGNIIRMFERRGAVLSGGDLDILEDSVFEPFAQWLFANPELKKALSDSTVTRMITEFVQTSEGAKLIVQQEDRMARTGGSPRSPKSRGEFKQENKDLIEEGRRRAEAENEAARRDARRDDILGKKPAASSDSEQARSTMQLAMKLRAEGKEQDAVLMEKMALDLDPEAAAQARSAPLPDSYDAPSLVDVTSRTLDTSPKGRANLDAVQQMLHDDGNEKLVQAGRRRAESEAGSRARSGSRLDDLLGAPEPKAGAPQFDTTEETEAWRNMELATKLRNQGKEDDAKMMEDMAASMSSDVVAKYRAEKA